MPGAGSRHFWPSNVPRTKLAEVPRLPFRKSLRYPTFESNFATACAGLLAALAGLPGCNGCGSQKPYTPFGVASSEPSLPGTANSASVAGTGSAAPTPSSSLAFAIRRAELTPTSPEAWSGSGLTLKAPPERRFAQVLPGDFDGDAALDAVAWLVPTATAKDAPAGELWYFPSAGEARRLSAVPSFVPSGPDCTSSTKLAQTGAHSVTLDVLASCGAALIARAPTRAIQVLTPSSEHPALLTLRVASPAPDETLDFSVDSSDQDHDGKDDVRLTVSLRAASESEASSADLVWLDRAAGASRAASEPRASLLRAASARTRSKRGTAGDPESSTLRLLSSLCAEGGVARVFDEEGAPFRCGELGPVVDSLMMNQVLASVAQGDFLRAFSVLNKDGWYFTQLSAGQRKLIERELLRKVSKLDAEPPLVATTPPALPRLPHYSPLWFEPDRALLIQGAREVMRLSADRATESVVSAEGGVPPWPLDIASPGGVRLLGAVHGCDRSDLLLTEGDATHPVLPSLATHVTAARPASCTGHGAGPAVTIAPLAFDDDGFEALIEGQRVSQVLPGKTRVAGLPALGTPRSPDGRWLVAPSRLGLLVVGEHAELWQTAALPSHGDASRFTDCVVANEARAVACIDSGRVVVFERPKPSASTPQKKK